MLVSFPCASGFHYGHLYNDLPGPIGKRVFASLEVACRLGAVRLGVCGLDDRRVALVDLMGTAQRRLR